MGPRRPLNALTPQVTAGKVANNVTHGGYYSIAYTLSEAIVFCSTEAKRVSS